MSPLEPRERRRRTLIAVVLAGVAPPGGHLYLGRPLRGFALLLASLAAGLAWVLIVPRSLHAAQAAALAGLLLLLAVILDAGLLARRSPEELPPRRLHRWWVYALLIVAVQLVVPDLLFRLLKSRAGLVLQTDRAMEPVVLDGETIVFERRPPTELLVRDALVVLETRDGHSVRRVAGLPGEEVRVVNGDVRIDGREWIADRLRLRHRATLDLDPVRLGADELLVLGDRRRSDDPLQGVVRADRLRGRASWVLLPPGFPRDPQFGSRLGGRLE